ncbi:uncharacterized protein LOC120157217 [Hibiscus syriacus]|uniref:uncharacterized protein LOC120157217 n=1 Tax=Hibiscus syriacus TaxID=106335 RepID=UPI0019221C87|nr:uncharacterized protein LOC120157217 [Hibiscus syriacus]
MTVLNHFYDLSDLKLNVSKTELYSVGISARNLDIIKSATGFKHGFLPVRYLGVPLVTKKLSEKDCLPLIDNIKHRHHNWAGKFLSYAGRLELIKTVLYSVVNFWSRQFILPQKVVKRLEQLCSRFLWKGSDIAASGARISWDKIYYPKSEGGLGLKNISSWNKTCMVHLIRKLLAGQGSLWIAWVHCYVIKSKSFAEINECPSYSWCFKKLIRLRSEALPIINYGLTRTRNLWEELRVHKTKVPWHKIVWFPLHIPKLSPTRDRLTKMGIASDELCVLCNEFPENRNHLFVHCTYATSLWNTILRLTSLSNNHSTWESRITWAILEWKGKSLLIIILKLAWTAFIYSVWEERNRRIFRGESRTIDQVIRVIKDFVRIKLSDRNLNRTDGVNINLCNYWGID